MLLPVEAELVGEPVPVVEPALLDVDVIDVEPLVGLPLEEDAPPAEVSVVPSSHAAIDAAEITRRSEVRTRMAEVLSETGRR